MLKDKTRYPLCSIGSSHEDRTSAEHHFKRILDLGKNINTNKHAKPTTLRTICTAVQITMTTLDTAAANDIKAFKAKTIRNTMTRKSFSCRRFARLSRHVLFIGHRPIIVKRAPIGPTCGWKLGTYIPDKKRNAPLRIVQLSGRSQVIGQFSLYQCKVMSGTAASHFFCNLASKSC